MDAFTIMLKNVLVFLLLALPGLVLIKTKLLKKEQSRALSVVLLYVGLPFLILNNTLNVQFSAELLKIILVAAAVGIGFMSLFFFATYPLTKGEKNAKTRGIMQFCMIFPNSGFLGIPLVAAIFPTRPLVMTALIIVNIITNTMMYTFGVYLITGDKKNMSLKKAALNPVLVAFVVGLLLNLLNVKAYLPEISSYAGYLGNIVTPISMIVLGMKLGEVSFKSLCLSWKNYYIAFIKLVAIPVIVTACVWALNLVFSLGADAVIGIFVAFGVSTAAGGISFADHYKGDTENAVAFTLGNTILSVITLPLLYAALCMIL